MKLCKNAIVQMMRTWHGVIYLTSSPLGLPSLVQALDQPIRMYKKIGILDLFCEVFNLPNFISNINASPVSENYGGQD